MIALYREYFKQDTTSHLIFNLKLTNLIFSSFDLSFFDPARSA